VIGLTIMTVRHLLDRDELDLTSLPMRADRSSLEPALA
jgi:hypothetical protein